MSVSYKKMWHLLLDKNMKKKDLAIRAGVSIYTMNKLKTVNSNEENIETSY